ncbi:MAG: protein kinase [Planctomycetes bacterium]|nr:protein kinase [Planctomycetota bacterium]
MPTPARIGRFIVDAELGRGGMGVVYRAHDPATGARVALKVLLHAEAEDLLRFEREARLLAQVQHPDIVRLLELGREPGGRPFVALELVEGESLAALLKRGPLEPLEAARLFEPLARALAHAHARGVVHRDLKPDNVLIDREGRAKLSDFGLARRTDAGASRLTATGTLLGTPAYMAPEQAAGGPVDARADVWGLGATLYAAVTGAPPFRATSLLDSVRAVLEDEVVSPDARGVALPPDLRRVIMTCLARDPAERFESADALADALAACLVRPRPRARWRRPLLLGLAAATGLGAVALAARPREPAAAAAPPPSAPPAAATSVAEADVPSDRATLRAAAAAAEAEGWPYAAGRAAWEDLAARGDAHAWARLARIHRRIDGHSVTAREAVARALAADPGEPLALVEDGYQAHFGGDRVRAAALLDAALRVAPDLADAHALAAALERSTLRGPIAPEGAARTLRLVDRALALDPAQVEAAIILAVTLPDDDLADVQRIVDVLDRALEGAPGNPLLLGQRGRLRVRLGHVGPGLDDLRRATALLPEDPAFAGDLALALLPLEDDEAALLALDRALDLSPNQAELLLGRAEVHLRRRDLERAFADANLFIRLVRDAGGEPALTSRALLLRGLTRYLMGEPRAAIEDARASIAEFPLALSYALCVWACLEVDDLDGALAAGEEGVARHPAIPETLAGRARARLAAGQVDAALADATRAAARPEATGQVLVVHAAALLAAGRVDEALAAARRACEEAGARSHEARLILGQTLARAGERAAAREALREVVRGATSQRMRVARLAWDALAALTEQDPGEAAAHEARARQLVREGRPLEALEAWLDALLRGPTATRWTALGTFARRHAVLLDWTDAALERALALDPSEPAAQAARALAAVRDGRPADLDALPPELPDTLLARADQAVGRDDGEAALALAARASAATPPEEDVDARVRQATLLMRRGRQRADAADLRRAAELLEEALAVDPACSFVHWHRAELRLLDRDVPGAIADLERATALAPEVPRFAAALAAALEQAGRWDDAADMWGRVGAVDPAGGTVALARRAVCLARVGRAEKARRLALAALLRAPWLPPAEAARTRAALEGLDDDEVRRALREGR